MKVGKHLWGPWRSGESLATMRDQEKIGDHKSLMVGMYKSGLGASQWSGKRLAAIKIWASFMIRVALCPCTWGTISLEVRRRASLAWMAITKSLRNLALRLLQSWASAQPTCNIFSVLLCSRDFNREREGFLLVWFSDHEDTIGEATPFFFSFWAQECY